MNLTTEVLVAGNYCHDTLLSAHGTFEVLGGSAAYISAVLSALDVRFEVVSKVGEDFLYASQVARPPTVVSDHHTTHFIDDFRSGERRSVLQSECAPIFPADLGQAGARIGLACGVAGELIPETLLRLKSLCPVVIADIQGLVRSRGPDGQLINLPLDQTPYAHDIERIDYLKIGEEELRFVDAALLSHRTRLLITRGRLGSTLVHAGRESWVPARPAQEVDSSGAGDCFTAGFAYGLLQGSDALEAMRLGNHFGALAVAQTGIPDFRAVTLP